MDLSVDVRRLPARFWAYSSDGLTVRGHSAIAIPTGLAFEIPEGYELQVRPRSSTLLKKGLQVIPGTIDSDYRGEVFIIVHNPKSHPVSVGLNSRLAQAVLAETPKLEVEVVEELSTTERGEGGLGSTGA